MDACEFPGVVVLGAGEEIFEGVAGFGALPVAENDGYGLLNCGCTIVVFDRAHNCNRVKCYSLVKPGCLNHGI